MATAAVAAAAAEVAAVAAVCMAAGAVHVDGLLLWQQQLAMRSVGRGLHCSLFAPVLGERMTRLPASLEAAAASKGMTYKLRHIDTERPDEQQSCCSISGLQTVQGHHVHCL